MQIPYTVESRPDTGVYNGKMGIWLFLASEVMLFGGLFSTYILLRTGAISWLEGSLSIEQGGAGLNVPLATFNTFVLIASSVTIVMAWASLAIGRAREQEIAGVELDPEDVQERITVSALSNPQKIRAESLKKFQLFMGLTILLSLVFLVAKAYEYNYKFSHGIYPKTHNFYAIYFTLTGLHALHIVGGVLVNGYFLLPWKSLLTRFWTIIYYLIIPVVLIVLGAFMYKIGIVFAVSPIILYVFLMLSGLVRTFVSAVPGCQMWETEPDRFINRIECAGLYWHFVDLVWIFLFPVLYLLPGS
ncbi:MAG: cytochrome c oxidase subunit 3 [Candidatus Poribacteria bacterium]